MLVLPSPPSQSPLSIRPGPKRNCTSDVARTGNSLAFVPTGLNQVLPSPPSQSLLSITPGPQRNCTSLVEPTGNGLAIVPADLKEASIQDSTDPRHLSFDDTSAYVASAEKAQASKMQVETDPVIEAARSCRRASLFSAVDRDNDGFISPQELRQALEVGLIRDGRQSVPALPSTPAAKAEEPLGKAAHVPMSERVIEASASSTRASASAVVDGSFLSPSAVRVDSTGLTPTPIQNEGDPQPMRTPQLAIMGLADAADAETSRNLQ